MSQIVTQLQYIAVSIGNPIGCPSPSMSVTLNGVSVGSFSPCASAGFCSNDQIFNTKTFYNNQEAMNVGIGWSEAINWPNSKSSLPSNCTPGLLAPPDSQALFAGTLDFLNKSSTNTLVIQGNQRTCSIWNGYSNETRYFNGAVQIYAKWANDASWKYIWEQHFFAGSYYGLIGDVGCSATITFNSTMATSFSQIPLGIGCHAC